MKSGTTSLFRYLAQHPAIARSIPKEPGYFAFDDVFDRGRDWYESLFHFDDARHVWAMDASTDYTKAPFCGDVPRRMAQMPDANFRLIYLLRHPLRRIESHARHAQLTRREVGDQPLDKEDQSLDAGVSEVAKAATLYARQLDAYRDLFDAGQILIIAMEEFSAHPQRVADRIWEFLGVPPRILPVPVIMNAVNQIRRSPIFWEGLRRIPGLLPLAHIIPKAIRHRIYLRFARPVKVPGRFRLTETEQRDLLVELSPDLVRLRDVYGFDVKRWWRIDLPVGSARPAKVSRSKFSLGDGLHIQAAFGRAHANRSGPAVKARDRFILHVQQLVSHDPHDRDDRQH